MPTNVREERIEWTAVDKASAVTSQVKRSVSELRSSIDTVKNALAAVGVTIGAGAMAKLYSDVLKANAALDDMAESTGSSVENLSRLQTVAKIGGHDFEGLTGQIGRMIKGLKGADEEGQAAGKALEFLGIKAKDSNGRFRDSGEILTEVAKKLVQYEDGGNKVALVQDLLGKGAERYLPFLKDLAEETGVHARLTAEQARQAELAEKNINRLKIAMEDARRELVIGITPAISEFIERLLVAQRVSGGFAGGLATMATAGTGDIPGRLREIEEELRAARAGQSTVLNRFTFGVPGFFSGIGESRLLYEQEYLKFIQRQEALKLGGPGALDARDLRLGQAQQLTYESTTKKPGLSAAQIAKMQAESLEAFNKEVATGIAELNVYLQKQREELEKTRDGYLDLIEPMRAVAREDEKILLMRKDRIITDEELQKIQLYRSDQARQKILELGGVAEDSKNAFAKLGFTATSALEDIILKGGDARDVIRALGADIGRIIFRQQIGDPLAAALGRGFGGLFGGGGKSAPDAQAVTGPYGGFDPGADYSFVGAFQGGTHYVPRTGMAWVHEGERIVPARENRKGGGSTFFIDARGADPAALARLEAMIRGLNGSIERRAVAASLDAQRRGLRA